MRLLRPQAVIMISGTLLIVVGIIAVCFQMYSEMTPQGRLTGQPPSQVLGATPNEFHITTRFPGLELIVIGAVLQIVGYLGTSPWKESPPAQ
jgi:hypothetical protein